MQNFRSLRQTVAALAVAGLLSGGLAAPAAAAPPDGTKDAAARTIDPGAVAALTRMSGYLAGLKSFELTADTTMEAVLRDGHQVEVGGTVRYWVRRPDRIRIDSETDAVTRQYFYDGKTFTLVAPLDGYFARAEAKPTVRETLAFAAQALDVELPLADLMDWGSDTPPLKLFERGFYVGTAKVGGVATEHYALIGKDLDLEVWIQQGDRPLPLKMAIVDRKAPGNPRFTARLAWTPDVQIPDETFSFKPTQDQTAIAFGRLKPGPKDGKAGK